MHDACQVSGKALAAGTTPKSGRSSNDLADFGNFHPGGASFVLEISAQTPDEKRKQSPIFLPSIFLPSGRKWG